MIYAKVDVKLRDHKLAHRAGAAMATWMWALLYVREHETDGHIPDEMIRLAWVGEVAARKHAARLVEVGLWAVEPDGWTICRYSDKNDTRETIDARRKETRERVAKHRSRNGACNTVTTTVTNAVPNALVPGSGSGSGSGSDLDLGRSDIPTSTPRATPTPANDNDPPAWWDAACQTVAMNVAPVDQAGARWLEYQAHRETKRIAPSQRDAVGWLSQVIRRERRDSSASRRVDTRQPLTGPDPEWLTRAKSTGTDGTEPF
jgi:hypothetical protein